jgi:beta-glucanase (GH16 family)
MNILLNKNYKRVLSGGCICFLALAFFSGCKKMAVQTLPARNWQLAWSDEFNSNAGAALDSTKWSFDIGNGSGGWGNQELEYYTNRQQNVSLDGGGNLMITANSESYGGMSFTSGRIKTKNLFSQTYGRFEARIKTPYGPGIWPAFWMLGANSDAVAWPQCGEIDIMELRGQQPNIVHGTVHGPGYSGANAITSAYGLQTGRFDQAYHIFAVEWTASKIDFFVDDYLYEEITPSSLPSGSQWVYDHPFYIILNVAVGGNYLGFPTSGTPFPQTMYVDYVRVYK